MTTDKTMLQTIHHDCSNVSDALYRHGVRVCHAAALTWCHDNGYTDSIGQGSYASVYAFDGSIDVIKIGIVSHNAGYMSWLNRVVSGPTNNRFFPRNTELHLFTDHSATDDACVAFAVRMERLQSGGMDTGYEDARTRMKRDIIHMNFGDDEEVNEAIFAVNEALCDARKLDRSAIFDLHGQNFMLRGRQLVITDPIA